jgi:hypothetical protein
METTLGGGRIINRAHDAAQESFQKNSTQNLTTISGA